MFQYLLMADDYDQRKVDRLDADWGFISTAAVNDASKPYETAVCHEDYNEGKHVIVEMYDTREAAQEGHDRWVATMTAETLPNELIDKGTSGISEMIDAFSDEGDSRRVFPRAKR